MKRIVKVLLATALMVVLMATTVSPAFAAKTYTDSKGQGYGYPVRGLNGGCDEGPYKAQGWGTSDAQGGYDACKDVNYRR